MPAGPAGLFDQPGQEGRAGLGAVPLVLAIVLSLFSLHSPMDFSLSHGFFTLPWVFPSPLPARPRLALPLASPLPLQQISGHLRLGFFLPSSVRVVFCCGGGFYFGGGFFSCGFFGFFLGLFPPPPE